MADDVQGWLDGMAQRLRGLPLFAAEDDEALQRVLDELRLWRDPQSLPDGVAARAAYVRVAQLPAGAALVRQGDLATELFVVLAGVAEARMAQPGRGVRPLDAFGPGAVFGEGAALAHRRASFTAVANTPCEVLAIDARLVAALHPCEGFGDALDEVYRERSLGPHLRSSPLLRDLADADLESLAAAAELVTRKPGEVLAEQGAPVDAFYLVRSGGIACVRTEHVPPFGQRTLAYWMANSTFGDHVVRAAGKVWPGELRVLRQRTDLVRIDRRVLEPILARNPQALPSGTPLGNRSADSGPPPATALAGDENDVMISRQSHKGGEALVIDGSRCIRCNLCVESCVAVHDDGVPRISKIGTRLDSGMTLITACYSCDVPECMLACSYGAIRRDARGMVQFVFEHCVGCAKCIEGCPYGVIRMTEPTLPPAPARFSPWAWLRDLFAAPKAASAERAPAPLKLLNIDGEQVEVQGKAIKCDRCGGLPFEACVYNCPTSAIVRRRPEELFA